MKKLLMGLLFLLSFCSASYGLGFRHGINVGEFKPTTRYPLILDLRGFASVHRTWIGDINTVPGNGITVYDSLDRFDFGFVLIGLDDKVKARYTIDTSIFGRSHYWTIRDVRPRQDGSRPSCGRHKHSIYVDVRYFHSWDLIPRGSDSRAENQSIPLCYDED